MIKTRITDIATIERAKREKIYKAGVTLLQVSATRGKTVYHNKDGTVEDRYAVIEPKIDCVPYYIYIAVTYVMPEFCQKYQTGLNIALEQIKNIWIPLPDKETQFRYSEQIRQVDRMIEEIEEGIKKEKEVKQFFLSRMFPR